MSGRWSVSVGTEECGNFAGQQDEAVFFASVLFGWRRPSDHWAVSQITARDCSILQPGAQRAPTVIYQRLRIRHVVDPCAYSFPAESKNRPSAVAIRFPELITFPSARTSPVSDVIALT